MMIDDICLHVNIVALGWVRMELPWPADQPPSQTSQGWHQADPVKADRPSGVQAHSRKSSLATKAEFLFVDKMIFRFDWVT